MVRPKRVCLTAFITSSRSYSSAVKVLSSPLVGICKEEEKRKRTAESERQRIIQGDFVQKKKKEKKKNKFIEKIEKRMKITLQVGQRVEAVASPRPE